MKKLITFGLFIVFAFIAVTFQRCGMDVFDDGNVSKPALTDSQYESILKENVGVLIAKSAESSEHFVSIHGYPVWESARWTEVDSKRMLVVPLVTGDSSRKFIVGVASGKEIPAVVTEMSSETRSSGHGGKRIYSLEGDILDEYGSLTTFIPQTRSGFNESVTDLTKDLLLNGGNAETLYDATHQHDSYHFAFQTSFTAGVLILCTTLEGKSSSTGDLGHAWLEFVDNDGNRTTFGTWSKGSGKNQGTEFRINEEIEMEFKATASKRVMIDYSELQRIINYNNGSTGGPGWSPIHNCSYYAAAAWGNVTGTPIDMRLYTPSNLEEWIKTH